MPIANAGEIDYNIRKEIRSIGVDSGVKSGSFFRYKVYSSSVKHTWLILFFAVLLITVCYSLIANTISVRRIEADFDELNQELYKKVQVQFDTMLNNFSRSALELATDADIAALTARRDSAAPSQQIWAMEKALANQSTTMRNAGAYHIYFSRSGMIGATDGMFDAQEYFETHYTYLNLRDSEWRRWILSDAEKRYISVTGIDGRQYLLLKYPLSGTVREIISSSLIVVLEESSMIRLVQNIPYFDDSLIQITDSDGEALFQIKPEDQQMTDFGYFEEREMPKKLRIGGKTFRFIAVTSANTGWQFAYCIPDRIYRSGFLPINLIFYAMLILVIGLEILVLWRSYSRSYSPLKGIVGMMGTGEMPGNEFETIRQNITRMLDAEKKYSSMLDAQKQFIRNNYLYLLLSGVLSAQETEPDILKEKDIVFPFPCFLTAALWLKEYVYLFQEAEEAMDDAQQFELMKLIVDNIFRDIAVKHDLHFYFVSIGRCCYVLFNLSEQTGDSVVIESFRETQQAVENYFNIHFAVALSSRYRDINGVPSAYKEAVAGLEYYELVGEPSVIEYREIADDSVAQYRLEYDFYNEIFKLIKQQCGEEASRVVLRRLDEKLQTATSYRVISYMIYDIVNHILGQFQEYLMDSSYVEELFRMELSGQEDIASAKEKIDRLIKQICTEISVRVQSADVKETKHKMIAEEIRSIINANYHDPEINVSVMADKLGFSRAFVSRIFQEQYGEGVLDYLNRVRCEKACELILTTHLTFEKIAGRTGFASISTFNRVFKKYEGVSPSAFQKRHLK